MAKGSRGGRRAAADGSASQSTTGIQVTGTGAGGASNVNYGTMDDAQAQALILNNSDIYNDPDFKDAQKLYISDANVHGDGFSYSQNLNYKLDNGKPLDPTEKFINDNLQLGMRSIGKDVTLVRACHDDILKQCGISDYSKLSETQLQKQLIGTTFTTKSYMSSSYNTKNNPFITGAQSGGREVYMNVKVGSSTKVALGAKSQSEVIVNKGTNFRITGIRYDGTRATPRGSFSSKPRVVVDVETY